MSMMLTLSHWVLKVFCARTAHRYENGCHQLEQVQRQKLTELLKLSGQTVRTYEDFHGKFPLTRYTHWKSTIDEMRQHQRNLLNQDKIVRYQPTSGSSDALKFIPYTETFLNELDQAIAAWLNSMYKQYPNLAGTTHYWSVSWLPESQRKVLENANLNDDSALLSFSKRILSYFTQAVPAEVAMAKSAEDAMFATATYLVKNHRLGLISVWSPTFAIQLLQIIRDRKDEIALVLETGKWYSADLNGIEAPVDLERARILKHLDFSQPHAWKTLWPRLVLVSSWDTASATAWATKLKKMLPHVAFEGKGLWATEGVVTIPYKGQYPLAYTSHFYEFLHVDSDLVVPAWQLNHGDLVSPVITTGSGLFRYVIDDVLLVSGDYKGVPTFEFQGRRMTVDFVGEKMDATTALSLLGHFKHERCETVSLLGCDLGTDDLPYYTLLCESEYPHTVPTAAEVDNYLKRNFHYELARNLGQLAPAKVISKRDAWGFYKQLAIDNGMIEGNIKPEPLKKFKMKFAKLEHV